MEVLPIKVLTDADSPLFGNLNVCLGELSRAGLPVASGICVAAPEIRLRTALEHYDFTSKEVFEQNLTLIKKEINEMPVPDELKKELKGSKNPKDVWLSLLDSWLGQIKNRIWQDGFYKGIAEGLEPKIIIFADKVESYGQAYLDPKTKETVITVRGNKLHPNDLKILEEVVSKADKKLFNFYVFDWILDHGIKLTAVRHLTYPCATGAEPKETSSQVRPCEAQKCAVKIFADLSEGLTVSTDADGIYLSPPKPVFDDLALKLVDLGTHFPGKPILLKLPDVTEGMGGLRGALRLLHQDSLMNPVLEAASFAVHKKGLNNIHLCLPFVRSGSEVLALKRELAVKKLSRRANLKHWLEIAVPENIVNLEDYLALGIDGVVLNLDELLSHLTGFDLSREELGFYKKEVLALIKFLKEPFGVLHKAKVPILAGGSLVSNHEVLEFLVDGGVYGIVVQKHESYSIKDLLYQVEKRLVLSRA